MADEKIEGLKTKPILTPPEFVLLLRHMVETDTDGAFETQTLADLLDRVPLAGETITLKGLKAGVLEAVTRGMPDGLGFPQIYGHLRRGGDLIPQALVEKALLELETEGRIYAERSGLTVYKVGRAPETAGGGAK